MPNENILSPRARTLLERVRTIFGASNVILTSTGRTESHNAAIAGASRTSEHIIRNSQANAFDFTVRGVDPLTVQNTIAASNLPFGQSIAEFGLGMGPRNHLSGGDQRRTTIARDGVYTDRRPSGQIVERGLGRKILEGVLGDLGSQISDLGLGAGKGLTATANALNPLSNTEGYIQRAGFGILALILIGSALLMLVFNKSPLKSVIKLVRKGK